MHTHGTTERQYLLERVDDAAVVQAYADGFAALSPGERMLAWHLYQAAIAGRDIFFDQRHAQNLVLRDLLEAIFTHASRIDPDTRRELDRYTKLFWINSGPYNNLTARKCVLRCTPAALADAAHLAEHDGAVFPLRDGETLDALLARLAPQLFDPTVDPMVTAKTPGPGLDILTASANNLYVGVSMADLDGFTERHPLNSRLVKRDGQLREEVCRIDGRYGSAIAEVVRHLDAALAFASEPMAHTLRALIRFYRTGDAADGVAADIAWVNNTTSAVDTINGFIEVYLDARGVKGAWAGVVFIVNERKTAAMQALAADAQWFEDHLPCEPRYRKPKVQGISARAIDVVIETGDAGPITPIGVNLPNDEAVRERHGSKSFTLSNICEAYDRSTLPSLRSEFCWDDEEAARAERWNAFTGELTTNIHEVIGHGSGAIAEHLQGRPYVALEEYYSTIEEARADLIALYFAADPRLVELGIIAAADLASMVHAEYEAYARTALVQLRRVREGTQLEEDHMRNRQLIVHWLLAHTAAIGVRRREGLTYYVVTDDGAFRDGVARLLAEVQRIKSAGDFAGARALVDTYGVHFAGALRDEVVARVDRLDLPSYTAVVMPRLAPVRDDAGTMVDVAISYPLDLMTQMLEYSEATRTTRAELLR